MRGLEVSELVAGLIRLTLFVATAFLVTRLVRRVPWPARGMRLRFVLIHAAAVPVCVVAFWAISIEVGQLIGARIDGSHLSEFMLIGTYLYIVIAGVSYAVEASARAVRAEATAAQMQLDTLRAQIQPHFLFNALHTVVQLIRIDPARAAEAAELVADLLRATMEVERDIVSLGDEWAFVSRYLELERIRFGDRLRVRAEVDPDLLDVRVPSFALQTLVENAVRHGAAPRIEPTNILVKATGTQSQVTLSVRNNGNGASTNGEAAATTGTGLNRLRERLVALHGNAARLRYGERDDGDFEAVVVLPRERVHKE